MNRLKRIVARLIFGAYSNTLSRIYRVNPSLVLIWSDSQRELHGNLLAISEAIKIQYPEYKVIIITRASRKERLSLSNLRLLLKTTSTAKYIFLDDFCSYLDYMHTKKEQRIIELWHACGAFKKFGFSRISTGDKIKTVSKGYKKITLATVSSEPVRDCYAEAFGIEASKIKALGTPRTDVFFDRAKTNKLRKEFFAKFPELVGKNIILFAPTYRGRKVEDASYDFTQVNFAKILQKLGPQYAIITKWHPAILNNGSFEKFRHQTVNCEQVLDLTSIADITTLLVACDILITDYSSLIFEWGLLNKPIIYYAYDLEEYEASRGIYFPFDEYVYGNVVKTEVELVKAIQNPGSFEKERTKFLSKFMAAIDGSSCERILKTVFDKES